MTPWCAASQEMLAQNGRPFISMPNPEQRRRIGQNEARCFRLQAGRKHWFLFLDTAFQYTPHTNLLFICSDQVCKHTLEVTGAALTRIKKMAPGGGWSTAKRHLKMKETEEKLEDWIKKLDIYTNQLTLLLVLSQAGNTLDNFPNERVGCAHSGAVVWLWLGASDGAAQVCSQPSSK